MTGGPRVLVISDDDDVAEPLAALLRRAGYHPDLRRSADGAAALRGAPPGVLILDRDLPTSRYEEMLKHLEGHAGLSSFPLVVLGAGHGGGAPTLPPRWHEDAWLAVGRPPHPGEILTGVAALLRLAFYRSYRALVHDLSQPVTAIHALSRSLERALPEGDEHREAAVRLAREAERLMTMMEQFQRTKSEPPG